MAVYKSHSVQKRQVQQQNHHRRYRLFCTCRCNQDMFYNVMWTHIICTQLYAWIIYQQTSLYWHIHKISYSSRRFYRRLHLMKFPHEICLEFEWDGCKSWVRPLCVQRWISRCKCDVCSDCVCTVHTFNTNCNLKTLQF